MYRKFSQHCHYILWATATADAVAVFGNFGGRYIGGLIDQVPFRSDVLPTFAIAMYFLSICVLAFCAPRLRIEGRVAVATLLPYALVLGYVVFVTIYLAIVLTGTI